MDNSGQSKELVLSGRVCVVDKKFSSNIENKSYLNSTFVRVVAKGKKFTNIDFRYCIFDGAYMRNCVFDSCNFSGCKFVDCNLRGSKFEGCTFDYATFDKTYVDSDLLKRSCPSFENLKLQFARSLRINFQQLGDAVSANKAINVELEATELHLKKGWKSRESYYRNKYKGLSRAKMFFEWLSFKALDMVWGNGESSWKLLRTVTILLILICIIDVNLHADANLLSSYWSSVKISPQVFLGVLKPNYYPDSIITIIFFLRLIIFGFFMSILIKRFNRR